RYEWDRNSYTYREVRRDVTVPWNGWWRWRWWWRGWPRNHASVCSWIPDESAITCPANRLINDRYHRKWANHQHNQGNDPHRETATNSIHPKPPKPKPDLG